MSFAGKRVLLLDGYARQTLPMIRGFKRIGCDVTVACYSKLDVGYASKYADHRLLLKCSKDDHEKQCSIIKELLRSKEYDLVVPMNDYGAIYLSQNKDYLEQYAHIAVNEKSVFDKVINKTNTMKICEENAIPAPKTYFTQNVEEVLNIREIEYPLVVKPRTACGSIGFNIAKNKEQLKKILNSTNDSVGPVFVQEYIPQDGSQYGAEAFRNRDGSYSFILIDEKPRWFPLDGGSPTINVTIHNEEMRDITKRVLDAINWIGYANVDFVKDCRTGQPKLIEINGRISAAVSIDEAVGYNVAQLICENEFGDVNTIYGDYTDNIKVSCLLTEMLWFIKSEHRHSNKPSMFSRKNTRDVIFSLKDPMPFFAFCIQSVMHYRNAMIQRKRV